MTTHEIPDRARAAALAALHADDMWHRPDSGGVWRASYERAVELVLTAALPHLRVQETAATTVGEICYNDGPPHPRTECHGDRCGLDPAPHPRPVVDREALREITTEKALRAYYMADEWDQEAWLGHHAEFADLILALLPTEEGDGSEVYFCPASGEMEIHPGGGFDTCCDRPQDHQTDIKWLTKLCHRLGKAEGRKEALTEIADEMAVEQDDLGYVTIQTDHDTWRILMAAKTSSQVTGAAPEPRTAPDGHTDLPEDAETLDCRNCEDISPGPYHGLDEYCGADKCAPGCEFTPPHPNNPCGKYPEETP